MGPSGIHYWFKRCLERAGLPATIKLHEMRHSAGDNLWRESGNLTMWLGGLAVGVSGGLAFVVSLVAAAAIFVFVRLRGGPSPRR